MSFKEFFNYYFSVNLSDYPRIGIDLPINLILLAFMIGMIVTIIVVNIKTDTNIQLIKRLIRYEAFSEDTAKTIEEIKFNSLLTKLTLSSNGRITKIVKRVGAKEYTYEEYNEAIKTKSFKEEKIDFTEAKFFIPEETLSEAKELSYKKNPSLLNTILLCILIAIGVSCLIICMPEILTFIDKLLSK